MKSTIKITATVLFIFFILFSSVATGIGLSPPQLRLENAPMGEQTKVATIVVSNTNPDASFIVLKVSSLEKNRPQKLRVICDGCRRDVGIQRGDLVNGSCPFCGSADLVFYDFPPKGILENISIVCGGYPFHKSDHDTYVSDDEIPAGVSIDVDILVNIADTEENYGKHWEVRILATAVEDPEHPGMITYGTESKFLIDTPTAAQKTGGVGVAVFVAVGALVCVIVVLAAFLMRVTKKKTMEKVAKTLSEGRKIL